MSAPIIIFAYNRPEHLLKTLNALAKNKLAKESEVYIYIDGPKNEQAKEKSQQVYEVAASFQEGFFSCVRIRRAEKNLGLAVSVINGVTEVINQFGEVIVVEDDSVADCNYLTFMNQALEFYRNDHDIFSIGGYTVPLTVPTNYIQDIILTQRSSSYAWATWKDRWEKIDWEVKDYKKFRWNFFARRNFNRWGNDRASMLDDQMNSRVNSWAIRFDYAMYKQKAYNILPCKSLIQNIGHDGSGTHNLKKASGEDVFYVNLSQNKKTFTFEKISLNSKIRKSFCCFFKVGKWELLKRFVSNLLYKKEQRK